MAEVHMRSLHPSESHWFEDLLAEHRDQTINNVRTGFQEELESFANLRLIPLLEMQFSHLRAEKEARAAEKRAYKERKGGSGLGIGNVAHQMSDMARNGLIAAGSARPVSAGAAALGKIPFGMPRRRKSGKKLSTVKGPVRDNATEGAKHRFSSESSDQGQERVRSDQGHERVRSHNSGPALACRKPQRQDTLPLQLQLAFGGGKNDFLNKPAPPENWHGRSPCSSPTSASPPKASAKVRSAQPEAPAPAAPLPSAIASPPREEPKQLPAAGMETLRESATFVVEDSPPLQLPVKRVSFRKMVAFGDSSDDDSAKEDQNKSVDVGTHGKDVHQISSVEGPQPMNVCEVSRFAVDSSADRPLRSETDIPTPGMCPSDNTGYSSHGSSLQSLQLPSPKTLMASTSSLLSTESSEPESKKAGFAKSDKKTKSSAGSAASMGSIDTDGDEDAKIRKNNRRKQMRTQMTAHVGHSYSPKTHDSHKGFLGELMQHDEFSIWNLVPAGIRRRMTRDRGTPVGKSGSQLLRSQNKRHQLARSVLESTRYEAVRALFAGFDLLFLAWNVQDAAAYMEANLDSASGGIRDRLVFVVASDFFCLFNIGEVVLKIYVDRLGFMQWSLWSWFDLLMASAFLWQCSTMHIYPHTRGHNPIRENAFFFAMFRVLRLFHIINLTTYIRNRPFFKEFRCMVSALTGSVWALIWSSLMVLIILVMVSVFFAEQTTLFCIEHEATHTMVMPLRENFGDVLRTILSLFMSISGGDDWGNIYATLTPLGPSYMCAFLGFMGFAVIALLNVVTAVFVENTMERSQNDRELMTQNEIEAKKEFLCTMQKVFDELDDDQSGEINLEELQDRMKDPKIGAYFGSLGVDVVQVSKLFGLLDSDSSGSIDKDEFTFGCLRLKGEAKSLDIAILHCELGWIRTNLAEVGKMITELADHLDIDCDYEEDSCEGSDSEVDEVVNQTDCLAESDTEDDDKLA